LFIKDNSQKAFQSFFVFLLFLHLLAAAILILSTPDKKLLSIGYISAGIFLTSIIAFRFFKSKKKIFGSYQIIVSIIFSVFWFLQAGILGMMCCIILLSFLQILQTKKTSILFSIDTILVKNILFSKNYSWPQVEYVILKDGLLTINFKSNKIIQMEVQEEFYNEIIFNAFVADKIKSAY
jgi:hypothetical protein